MIDLVNKFGMMGGPHHRGCFFYNTKKRKRKRLSERMRSGKVNGNISSR